MTNAISKSVCLLSATALLCAPVAAVAAAAAAAAVSALHEGQARAASGAESGAPELRRRLRWRWLRVLDGGDPSALDVLTP